MDNEENKTSNKKKWFKWAGIVAFLFFLAKGLLWLSVPLFIWFAAK